MSQSSPPSCPPDQPRAKLSPPVEGVDYYFDKDSGLLVMTAHYLERRGFCCKNGCRHCPYGFLTDTAKPQSLKD